jgi:ribosomal protein L34E
MTRNIRRKRSPGGRLLEHKIKKIPPQTHCKICGALLRTNTHKKSKSGKRVSRPHSGDICHGCLKTIIQVSNI